MKRWMFPAIALLCLSAYGLAQTVDELVAKNIEAKGGLDKIKAVKTRRMTGRAEQSDTPPLTVVIESARPDDIRQDITVAGMTMVQAYDGKAGWMIQPFSGRKDPQLMGEDDLRDLTLDADIDGPLVDYKAKGNSVEYMGHDTVDGDDTLRLKVTLKNGDILYYDLDPDTYLEIRRESQEFIRGSVKEQVTEYGSYKPVEGVMYPFSMAIWPKSDPTQALTVTLDKVEVNVPLAESVFAVPPSLKH
jgi:outer membrane lipoprotein-sorting protein